MLLLQLPMSPGEATGAGGPATTAPTRQAYMGRWCQGSLEYALNLLASLACRDGKRLQNSKTLNLRNEHTKHVQTFAKMPKIVTKKLKIRCANLFPYLLAWPGEQGPVTIFVC